MSLTYRAAKDSVTGQLALLARAEGAKLPFSGTPEYPVAVFTSSSKGFPLKAQQVAENIADLLNRKVPVHQLSSGAEHIFYSRSDEGIVLRTRGEQGVSVPSLAMLVSSKSSVADLGHDTLAKMDADFMQRVCKTIVPETALTASAQQRGPSGPAVKL